MAASMALLAVGAMPAASAVAAPSTETTTPLRPAIDFPSGDSVAEGGQITIRFDADGDTTVTGFRYSVDDTHLDSEVPAAPDGTATVTVAVGDFSGERPVYAVAVDGEGHHSALTQAAFTVTVIWNLRGQALDLTTWLPAVGATIRLEPAGIEVVTGPDGGFRFAVEPGLYTLTGTHAGPPSLFGSQELLLDDQGLTFDLYLFPQP